MKIDKKFIFFIWIWFILALFFLYFKDFNKKQNSNKPIVKKLQEQKPIIQTWVNYNFNVVWDLSWKLPVNESWNVDLTWNQIDKMIWNNKKSQELTWQYLYSWTTNQQKSYYKICESNKWEKELVDCKGLTSRAIKICEAKNQANEKCILDSLAVLSWSSYDNYCYLFKWQEKNTCNDMYILFQSLLILDPAVSTKNKCDMFKDEESKKACLDYNQYFVDYYKMLIDWDNSRESKYNSWFCATLKQQSISQICSARISYYKTFIQSLYSLDQNSCANISNKYYRIECEDTINLFTTYIKKDWNYCNNIVNITSYEKCLNVSKSNKQIGSFDNVVLNVSKNIKEKTYCELISDNTKKSQCLNYTK